MYVVHVESPCLFLRNPINLLPLYYSYQIDQNTMLLYLDLCEFKGNGGGGTRRNSHRNVDI